MQKRYLTTKKGSSQECKTANRPKARQGNSLVFPLLHLKGEISKDVLEVSERKF